MTVRRAESEGEFLGLCGSPVGIRKTLKNGIGRRKGAFRPYSRNIESRHVQQRISNSPERWYWRRFVPETLSSPPVFPLLT